MSEDSSTQAEPTTQKTPMIKWALLLVVVLVVSICSYALWQQVQQTEANSTSQAILKIFSNQESTLRQFQQSSPFIVGLIALGIYALATGLSIPGAAILTLAYGWFFGFGAGLLIVSFASTLGATISMLMSRFFFRELVEARFAKTAQKFNEALQKEGSFYLLTLRLIPQVPFFVINLAMGLTSFPVVKYWIVSQLGMLPGTAVYVYAGSSIPSLQQLANEGIASALTGNLKSLLIAFTLLGVVPLVLKLAVKWFRKKPVAA